MVMTVKVVMVILVKVSVKTRAQDDLISSWGRRQRPGIAAKRPVQVSVGRRVGRD